VSLSRNSTVSELRIWPTRSPDGLRVYPERTPVFLLRQHYYTDSDTIILCDFQRTVDLVRKRGPRDLEARTFLHWFPDGAAFEKGRAYSILEALLLRVNGASAHRTTVDLKRAALFRRHGAALAAEKTEAVAAILAEKLLLDKLDLYWKIYISQHYDLMLCVQDTLDDKGRLCMLSDEDLLHDEDDVPEQSAFYRNLPRDELAFWAGDVRSLLLFVAL